MTHQSIPNRTSGTFSGSKPLTSKDDRLDVAYDRVSLDEQQTGGTTESQWGENQGWFQDTFERPLTRRYSDVGISAYSGVERPDFNRLCADMAARSVRTVTVWHADRLTRDPAQALYFIDLCIAHSVRLYSTQRGGEYNFHNPQQHADFLTDVVNARKESALKAKRVGLARLRQARNGEWGGGVRPFGWGVDTGRVTNKCLNPKAPIAERQYVERPVLDMTQHNKGEAAEIQTWATELPGTQGNIAALIRSLKARGVETVSTKEGRTYKHGKKEFTGSQWSSRTIVQILLSPRTSGHSVYKGEIVKYNAFPAIISDEQRKALLILLKDPARRKQTGNQPKWLGSLIYECPHCTTDENDPAIMTVRKSATGVDVYRCRNCGRGRQSAELLDDFVARLCITRLSRPDVSSLVKPVKEVDFKGLREELTELEAAKTEAAQAFGARLIKLPEFTTACATSDLRIAEINKELAEAVQDDPLAPFAVNYGNAEQVWKGLSLARKRETVRLLYRIELQPLMRRAGRPPKNAPKRELDLSKLIITPRGKGAKPIDLSRFKVKAWTEGNQQAA
ncbi:recombinase family protein [Streptomyces sp. NBC_01451]|uniref:recombinase family protein n=1 Tax=Streptomyces sp. NBC_01451 TaxID=2903872 RepID=UPI002E37C40F|nr:recombinase family protein [Streptomyces sp. NBC_01451]